MPEISMHKLLEAGAHFGHQTRRWNPKMEPYIYGHRNGIYILDLQKSVPMVAKACRFLAETVANGGNVLFVGTKRQAQGIVREQAQRCKMHYITHRWLGGLITNFRTIRGGMERLKKIETMMEDGSIDKLVKKERMKIAKEKVKLERVFSGIKDMSKLPATIFIVDPMKESIAVKEANRKGIPIVALVDTNCDPDPIDFVIPCNDDATKTVSLITAWIADSCLEGLSRRDERLAAEADKDSHPSEDTDETAEGGLVVTRRRKRTTEIENQDKPEDTLSSGSVSV